jgi:hypothetical protein
MPTQLRLHIETRGFLMRCGYTTLGCGWQGYTIGRCTCRMTEEGSGKLLRSGTTVFVIRQRQRA